VYSIYTLEIKGKRFKQCEAWAKYATMISRKVKQTSHDSQMIEGHERVAHLFVAVLNQAES